MSDMEPEEVLVGCFTVIWVVVWVLFLPTVGLLYLLGFLA